MERLVVRAGSLMAASLLLVALNGCGILRCTLCASGEGSTQAGESANAQSSTKVTHTSNRSESLIITVTGYGAPNDHTQNKPQQMLMAMRASEVDAYRTLAERVQGVQLSASTKVADFVTNYDHLRAVVDSYIQSSKVISQGLTNQGYYETTLSLTLDQEFFQSFSAAPVPKTPTTKTADNPTPRNRISTLSTADSHYDIGSGQGWAWAE